MSERPAMAPPASRAGPTLVLRLAPLLAASGFCALLYQALWLRAFRSVFGASTLASAAVLGIFMGGLGCGAVWLGRRADRAASPLRLYALLELGIALGAAASPWSIRLVEWIYLALGGSPSLGKVGGTAVRLVLATLVLALPTVLMGGTLPAVARAVQRVGDAGRRELGLLYAVNTLGGVAGVLAATFYAVEHLGVRRALLLAALLNALVALAARALARSVREAPRDGGEVAAALEPVPTGKPHAALIATCAGLVGFVFLLMEQVWYRMLAPLLGGSSYTFGLILAVALCGIGLGSLLYGLGAPTRRPTLGAFAITCALEALLIALPLALGDRLAELAALLRQLAALGFEGLVLGWVVIAVLVVAAPAVVAGYQFPMLVARRGRGAGAVGAEVGITYGANTAGAIVGSLAGGFGLLPLLSAPGAWRLCVALLAILTVVVLLVASDRGRARVVLAAATAAALAVALALAPGPSAFWRHGAIGAGRLDTRDWDRAHVRHAAEESLRRSIVWERDGVESAVGLDLSDSYSFIVNGKSDGSAFGDAPMQVMSGLVGTALHPAPRRALVIGLGTGSTAGWIARVPSLERVDVVELEPAVLHVAEVLRGANQDVLRAPNVHLVIGDGREFLLATDESYDIIFSEPSNPYRAGVAGLFSADFYRAVRRRLRPGGLFLQWLQGYETDATVVQTAYATLASVFPSIESWRPQRRDLLLVASAEALHHDGERLRARVRSEPYASALSRTWGVEDAEGFYSGYLAGPALAQAVAAANSGSLNTDDRPIIEFGFARNLGRTGLFELAQLAALARSRGADALPAGTGLDPARVEEMRQARGLFWSLPETGEAPAEAGAASRAAARRLGGTDLDGACAQWSAQSAPPLAHADRLLVATCLSVAGDARAPGAADALANDSAVEAEIVRALHAAASKRTVDAEQRLTRALVALRSDPWVHSGLAARALALAATLGRDDAERALRLAHVLAEPFACDRFHLSRLRARVALANAAHSAEECVAALAPFEPHPPWEKSLLALRVACYRSTQSPLLVRAQADYDRFVGEEPPALADLPPPAPAP